jgi:hypothetical protein
MAMNPRIKWISNISVFALLCGNASLAETTAIAGQQSKKLLQTVQVKAELDDLLYLPEKVPPAGKKWPLM